MQANTIHARVETREDFIVYEYLHENKVYEIQAPKTKQNENLEDGQMVIVTMSLKKVK